ncbi:ATP-binding protein [Caenimonas terrae]|uniref:histidine kinase n=1 Tax=Caenimonas terrae TaxID=696074 RepID=A0ABW0NAD5_9BURK
MRHRLVTVKIGPHSLTLARERARQVGELFGLETLQRTRLVTAVSEIARNTAQYAGEGALTFLFDTQSLHCAGQALVAEITDKGPGIHNLQLVSQGLHRRDKAVNGVTGIVGARRLVDHMVLRTPDGGGTVVTMEMALPRSARLLSVQDVNARVEELVTRKPRSAMEELEQQNREMMEALEETRRRQLVLEQADLRKNEFLAILAHELRNPLATLNMTLAILRRKANISPEELVQRSDVMARQITHLVRLVDDLTDVTRVDKGKVELQASPVELNSLVKDALEMTAAAIQARHHAVAFTPTQEDLWVHGDSSRLLQVVGNVLQNAAKYTPDEGRIEVQLRTIGTKALIAVRDNGAGIDAEMLPQVFGMFVQARSRSSDDQAGLGVGLTLADRLVRDHGGSISVTSEGLGRGSEFTITLPLLQKAGQAMA